MQRTTFLGRLRLTASFHPHGVLSLAADPVRVAQLETALIFRPRLQVQDAAGKSVGNRVLEILAHADKLARRQSAPVASLVASQIHRPPETAPRLSRSDSHPRRLPTRSPGSGAWGAPRRVFLPASCSRPHSPWQPGRDTRDMDASWRLSARVFSDYLPVATQHTLGRIPNERLRLSAAAPIDKRN